MPEYKIVRDLGGEVVIFGLEMRKKGNPTLDLYSQSFQKELETYCTSTMSMLKVTTMREFYDEDKGSQINKGESINV